MAAAGGAPPGQGATEAAIDWLLETDGGSNPGAASLQPLRPPVQQMVPERCKMVLVVRTDLGMSPGKVAAQCVHGAYDMCMYMVRMSVGAWISRRITHLNPHLLYMRTAALGVYQALAEGDGAVGGALISSWQVRTCVNQYGTNRWTAWGRRLRTTIHPQAQGEPVIALKCEDLPTLYVRFCAAVSIDQSINQSNRGGLTYPHLISL